MATCNSGGAGEWEDHYAVWLQGLGVVVLPHNVRQATAMASKLLRCFKGRPEASRC